VSHSTLVEETEGEVLASDRMTMWSVILQLGFAPSHLMCAVMKETSASKAQKGFNARVNTYNGSALRRSIGHDRITRLFRLRHLHQGDLLGGVGRR
jgi:hypothetical protein